MRNHLNKLHYLLLVAFLLAMTGCGAHNLAGLGGNGGAGTPGAVNAKLAWKAGAKNSAKSVKLSAPAGVSSVQVTVTGTGIDGNPVPVVRGSVDTATNQGTVSGIYPGKVTLVVKALDASSNVLYEGFAIGVTVTSGATTTIADPIVMAYPIVKSQDNPCQTCHETTLDIQGQNLVADYKQSGHYTNGTANYFAIYSTSGVRYTGCAGCHGPNHNDHNPALSGRCAQCHGTTTGDADHVLYLARVPNQDCSQCHVAHNFGLAKLGCVGCHSIPQNATAASGSFVSDNNGVRAAATEFSKWSHHVTGVTLNNAHCAACHLEGKVDGNGDVVVDASKHMADNKTHLRIVNNPATDGEFKWDPSSPNHSGMDNFCMACHSAGGAVSPQSVLIQGYINSNGIAANGVTAGPLNPFGDTISNRYDKMMRPRVTNVDNQFDTTNNSHHGVKGPRYSGRTRTGSSRVITSAATFAANSSATLQGIRSTIYDAGNFNALYVPLADAAGETAPRTGSADLGDDSTLHCGDCHTVGQYAPGSASKADGTRTTVAIGAHGANNEYLLRNSIGTDERHVGVAYTTSSANVVTVTNPNAPYLVCFNCHSYNKYGSIFIGTGINAGNTGGFQLGNIQSHAGEYDTGGRCNGPGNTLSFNGYTTGVGTDGFSSRFTLPPAATVSNLPATYDTTVTQYATTSNGRTTVQWYDGGQQAPDFGNVFGIQCLNCHNSGIGNAYGGIHGSANDTSWNGVSPSTLNGSATGGWYIDGMGNANKVERFLPGLGNAMHVPGTLGGVTGGSTAFQNGSTANSTSVAYKTGGVANDTNWEQKHWQQTASTVINYQTAVTTGLSTTGVGAGCYTLGTSSLSGNVTAGLQGPSQTGLNGPATALMDNWGGCEDHTAAQGKGNHGFIKRIIRPITY